MGAELGRARIMRKADNLHRIAGRMLDRATDGGTRQVARAAQNVSRGALEEAVTGSATVALEALHRAGMLIQAAGKGVV